MVVQHWQWLSIQKCGELNQWIVMSNPEYGILILTDASRRGGSRTAPTNQCCHPTHNGDRHPTHIDQQSSPIDIQPQQPGNDMNTMQIPISCGIRSKQTSPSVHSPQRARLFYSRHLFHHPLHPSPRTDIWRDRGWDDAIGRIWQIVTHHWQWLAVQYPYVTLDKWIVVPNHLHGILDVTDASRQGGSRTAPTIYDTQPTTFSSIDDRSHTSFTA